MIQFGDVDPLALCLGLFAILLGLVSIWFTWQESRRNNTPIIRVRKCSGYERIPGGPQFDILLHNHGIGLWNITVYLAFRLEDHGGSVSFELYPKTPAEDTPHSVQFARGMLAEYKYDLARLTIPGDDSLVKVLGQLKDAGRQKAQILVKSQGYLAYSIPIGGFWDRVRGRWNRFASKVNSHFDKRVERPGDCPLLIEGNVLPKFLTLEKELMFFIWAVARRLINDDPHLVNQ